MIDKNCFVCRQACYKVDENNHNHTYLSCRKFGILNEKIIETCFAERNIKNLLEDIKNV